MAGYGSDQEPRNRHKDRKNRTDDDNETTCGSDGFSLNCFHGPGIQDKQRFA